MNQYLIPANSKRSMLILGIFNKVDLIIFTVGGGITLFLMLIVGANSLKDVFIILTPLLISAAMIAPVPNQHNIWTLTANIYHYYSNKRKYYWRGWCFNHGEESQD